MISFYSNEERQKFTYLHPSVSNDDNAFHHLQMHRDKHTTMMVVWEWKGPKPTRYLSKSAKKNSSVCVKREKGEKRKGRMERELFHRTKIGHQNNNNYVITLLNDLLRISACSHFPLSRCKKSVNGFFNMPHSQTRCI